jgi:hypothetical protein
MADKAFFFTEESVEQLRKQFEEQRKSIQRHYSRPEDIHYPQVSATQYIARTPDGGIPALIEDPSANHADRPGSAECEVYSVFNREDVPELVSLDFRVLVFNIEHAPVGGNRWVRISKDSFGNWIVQLPRTFPTHSDTGTGPGIGDIPADEYGDPEPAEPCGEAEFYEYRYRCEDSPGTGTGTAEGGHLNEYRRLVTIDFDPTTGCLRRTYGTEFFVQSIGCCDPSCASPGGFDTGTGTGTSDGSGGSGGNGETVATTCCVEGIPTTLFATVSGGVSGCTCANGTTIELTYNGSYWVGSTTLGTCGKTISMGFQCLSGTGIRASWSCNPDPAPSPPFSIAPSSSNCATSTWTFESPLGSSCCSSMNNITMTVTP